MLRRDSSLQILEGEVDLVDLDEKSLALRGKRSKQASSKTSKSPTKASGNVKPKRESLSDASAKDVTGSSADQDREELEALIDTSDKTDFQKRCLKALLQIPRGQFSTYGKLTRCSSAFCMTTARADAFETFRRHGQSSELLTSSCWERNARQPFRAESAMSSYSSSGPIYRR